MLLKHISKLIQYNASTQLAENTGRKKIASGMWRGLEQSLIDDAVDQWPTRLRACVCTNGEHFEHTL